MVEVWAAWYSAMVVESSLLMSNRHIGRPRLSLRPDQCGYSKGISRQPFGLGTVLTHEHSGLLEILYLDTLISL